MKESTLSQKALHAVIAMALGVLMCLLGGYVGGGGYVGRAFAAEPASTAEEASPLYYDASSDGSWSGEWVSDGWTLGRPGAAVSAFKAKLGETVQPGGIYYRVRGEGNPWPGAWESDGTVADVAGKGLVGIQVKLGKAYAARYDIVYRTFTYAGGWSAWKRNGAATTTAADAHPIARIQMKLVRKGASAPRTDEDRMRVAVVSQTPTGETPTCNWLRRCGFQVERVTSVEADISGFDGLVVPGSSADVTPSLYGAEPHPKTTHTDLERDMLQIGLIKKFAEAEKPVFGICGGEQHINVAFGGTLVQHIPGWHERYRKVKILKRSWLYKAYGHTESVYHYHHQCVDRPADGFVVTQRDLADGVIEGIEHRAYPIYGTQWHPESMGNKGLRVGRAFVRECAKYHIDAHV